MVIQLMKGKVIKLRKKKRVVDNERAISVVSFVLGKEEFAVGLKYLKEVLRPSKVTPIPSNTSFIEGVINLRGEVIPIIDMRKRFGLESKEFDEESRILIIELYEDAGYLGFIVDLVHEVIKIKESSIKSPLEEDKHLNFVKGVAKLGDRFITLLNLAEIPLSHEEVKMERFV